MPLLPSSREFTNGMLLTSGNDQLALPGASAMLLASILIPFKHRILRAWVTTFGIVNAGAMTMILREVDDGGATGGTNVGTILSATDIATTNLFQVNEITLAAADKIARPANKCYFILGVGNASTDRMKSASMTILVSPEPRKAL